MIGLCSAKMTRQINPFIGVLLALATLTDSVAMEEVALPEEIFFGSFTPTENIVGDYAVRQAALAKHGIKLSLRQLPAKRMSVGALTNYIHGFSASDYTEFERDKFVKAKYPHFVYIVSIYYKKQTDWQPSWPPNAEFGKRKGVSMNYSYYDGQGLSILQVNNQTSGVKMVNSGRVDYWLDVIPPSGYQKYLKSEEEGFVLETIFYNPLSLYYPDTPEGRRIRDLIDNERALMLQDLDNYFDLYTGKGTVPMLVTPFKDYISYMRREFPELLLEADSN